MTRRLATALLFASAAVYTPSIHAQGCAQCRDSTGATPVATQRAYGHAIELMTGAAAILFVATVVMMKRQP